MMQTSEFHSEKGFTFIEALVAMVILSIGIFSLYSMQLRSVQGNSKAMRITDASNRNADQMEMIIGLVYNDATIDDTDSDGSNQDVDSDGVDDNGGDFGLDDIVAGDPVPANNADGSFTTGVNNRYTVFWNVAIDYPIPNVKTIRIHVQDSRQELSRPVTFTYIKADII
jgi:prepilin-type N-terminal cleavage/methylation domain-containing protein